MDDFAVRSNKRKLDAIDGKEEGPKFARQPWPPQQTSAALQTRQVTFSKAAV